MREAIKNIKTSKAHQGFQFICKNILWYCLKCRKNIRQEQPERHKEI